MAFPALYLLMTAVFFDIPAKQCVRILLSPSYYILCFWAVLSGYGLWEMKRWAWYVFFITCFLVGYSNALIVSEYGATHHKVLSFIFSLFCLIALMYRVSREVRVPYFLPKIRWWESNPRYRLVVPVTFFRQDALPIEGEILDLSIGGCFIKTRNNLTQDENISLKFSLYGQTFECLGNVVWRTQSTVTHPKGMGIKFGILPRKQRKVLKAINHHLKKISRLYRSSRYLMNQDEFFKELEQMQAEKLIVFSSDKPGIQKNRA